MGRIEKNAEGYYFRQDEGEITARFDNIEEKAVLSHRGNRFYQRVFNLLVVIGGLYLALIFWLY